MIIWINGAFGSGKTQAAHELQRRLAGSFIYDPEKIGYFIRKNIPDEIRKSDFQQYTIWREMNFSMLSYLANEYEGVIIVPMTIVDPAIFTEIVTRLENDGITVKHFALCATKDTLLKRLKSRGEGKNSWPARQIDRCIEGLSHETFQHHIDTNEMRTSEVVSYIATKAEINLLADTRSNVRKNYDRIKTQLLQLRFFN
ncbi:AAA family ATPase [Paenibacillus sp. GSMTC-2017]|uniref:AAA family ATPase n=1 Tax=Paenibacillus sp. GSMTC-2017 TaxID=2794350 RepID=UPI0018D9F9D9|nr:AAA family ATPase [Paenibacillus sp. GSMTC-2017]MBH5316850.1 AAA family ATPase [Paenibacillus sp. GSMTC-2017]